LIFRAGQTSFVFNCLKNSGAGMRGGSAVTRCYSGIGMKKPDIAKRMARQAGVSEAEAADCLDHVVGQILRNLRQGKIALLPGLGKFRPRADGKVAFQRQGGKRRG
jgi:hypothetical protein